MSLVNIECVDTPLDINGFNCVAESEYPYCLIGFQLKNSYDQKRINLKSPFATKDIIHILPTAKLTPTFFRGIELKLKPKLSLLSRQLGNINTSFVEGVDLQKYKNILSEFNLTCDECYAYLRKGIYPIDGSCLKLIADTDYDLNALYDSLDTSDIPVFQSFSSFTIFILCNETLFSGTGIRQQDLRA